MSTLDKLKEIYQSIMPDSEINLDLVNEKSLIMEDLGLNSIGVLYLVLAIEEEFNITMHNSSIESFKTMGDVISYIEENI